MSLSVGLDLETAIRSQRMLADDMPVLVMMADPDGTVNFFNRQWFEYTGQEHFDRDVDNRWTRYIHPDDVARVGAVWADHIERGVDNVHMEYRLLHEPSGSYRWITARATALRNSAGEIVQWIGTGIDVDDVRRENAAFGEIAHAYQRMALPTLAPVLNGMHFDVAYRSSSRALTACGDWYDAFPLAGGQTAISIGDVMGHGVEAATLMSKYREVLRALALRTIKVQNGGPHTILSDVEETIVLGQPGASATAFLGIISEDRNSMWWSCAGHIPALAVLRDGTSQWLDLAQDPPLGARFGQRRRAIRTSLEGVARIFVCTDGLLESSRNLEAGMRRFRELAENSLKWEQPAQAILRKWEPSELADDVAILSVTL